MSTSISVFKINALSLLLGDHKTHHESILSAASNFTFSSVTQKEIAEMLWFTVYPCMLSTHTVQLAYSKLPHTVQQFAMGAQYPFHMSMIHDHPMPTLKSLIFDTSYTFLVYVAGTWFAPWAQNYWVATVVAMLTIYCYATRIESQTLRIFSGLFMQ